jgi:ATP-dependent protease ClpP protease subunit
MKNRIQGELTKPRKWFDVKASGTDTEIYIYDVIGPDFWGDGLRAIDLVRQIKDAKSERIVLHINSPGGDVFDGMSIRHALQESGKPVRAIVDGIAASIASLIFATGSERIMPQGSMLMIHNAWTYAVGNHLDMTKAADTLKKVDSQLVAAYDSILNVDETQIRKLMEDETYFEADEAEKNGFATEVTDKMKVAACAWDLGILGDMPHDGMKRLQAAKQKRALEQSLRDAGYSASEAKRIAFGPRDETGEDIAAAIKKTIALLKS